MKTRTLAVLVITAVLVAFSASVRAESQVLFCTGGPRIVINGPNQKGIELVAGEMDKEYCTPMGVVLRLTGKDLPEVMASLQAEFGGRLKFDVSTRGTVIYFQVEYATKCK
ncbi:MAG: hypothetical protein HY617_02745 [Candidatus Sungbacteria bacterium]|nr:hypothetical protein [Candidatus Sungbacteria bacterium]